MARGGFPGMGGGNMGNMMKKMQKMQKDMEKAQKELEEEEIEVTAGGGAIKAVVNGKKELVSMEIDESVVDPEDVDMLQDLVIAAVNEAMREVDDLTAKKMGKFTGGMNIPGM